MDLSITTWLAIQLIAGLALLYSSFCRLTRTNHETIHEIRLAVYLQSVAAMLVVAAPYLPLLDGSFWWRPLETPGEIWLFLLISSASIQIATARHWGDGVPRSYIRPECRPNRRAGDDFRVTQ